MTANAATSGALVGTVPGLPETDGRTEDLAATASGCCFGLGTGRTAAGGAGEDEVVAVVGEDACALRAAIRASQKFRGGFL